MLLLAGCTTIRTSYDCKQAGWKGSVAYPEINKHGHSSSLYCSNGEIIDTSFVTDEGLVPLLDNGFEAVYTEYKNN